MDRAVKSLMCLFGLNCKRGLDCHCGHTVVEKKLFADRKAFREKEWMAPCGFCAVGRCRYGAECERTIRSRLLNAAYENQRVPAAESESDYASAESGSDSGDDNTGDEDADEPGCESGRALSMVEVAPVLSEDWTECVKGWGPNVGAAAANVGHSGVGEPPVPVFWVLQVLDAPVPPGTETAQLGVDMINFQFNQSRAAAVSQKVQRCEARQQKLIQSEAATLMWDANGMGGDRAGVREFGLACQCGKSMIVHYLISKLLQWTSPKWRVISITRTSK